MDPKQLFLNKPVFGTYNIHSSKVIQTAIQAGYRHFDSATGYENHQTLAEGIKQSKIARQELFLASKLNQHDLHSVQSATETILEELETDYLDLLYLHTPNLATAETRETLVSLREQGLINQIGISNLDIHLLTELLSSGYPLSAVQVEIHPYYWSEELIETCHEHSICLYGYRPLGGGKTDLLVNPLICKIATRHKKTPSQIILRWLIEKGVVPIVKSQNPQRQLENLDFSSIDLSSSDIQSLDSLKTVNQPTCHWQKKSHFTVSRGIGFSCNG